MVPLSDPAQGHPRQPVRRLCGLLGGRCRRHAREYDARPRALRGADREAQVRGLPAERRRQRHRRRHAAHLPDHAAAARQAGGKLPERCFRYISRHHAAATRRAVHPAHHAVPGPQDLLPRLRLAVPAHGWAVAVTGAAGAADPRRHAARHPQGHDRPLLRHAGQAGGEASRQGHARRLPRLGRRRPELVRRAASLESRLHAGGRALPRPHQPDLRHIRRPRCNRKRRAHLLEAGSGGEGRQQRLCDLPGRQRGDHRTQPRQHHRARRRAGVARARAPRDQGARDRLHRSQLDQRQPDRRPPSHRNQPLARRPEAADRRSLLRGELSAHHADHGGQAPCGGSRRDPVAASIRRGKHRRKGQGLLQRLRREEGSLPGLARGHRSGGNPQPRAHCQDARPPAQRDQRPGAQAQQGLGRLDRGCRPPVARIRSQSLGAGGGRGHRHRARHHPRSRARLRRGRIGREAAREQGPAHQIHHLEQENCELRRDRRHARLGMAPLHGFQSAQPAFPPVRAVGQGELRFRCAVAGAEGERRAARSPARPGQGRPGGDDPLVVPAPRPPLLRRCRPARRRR